MIQVQGDASTTSHEVEFFQVAWTLYFLVVMVDIAWTLDFQVEPQTLRIRDVSAQATSTLSSKWSHGDNGDVAWLNLNSNNILTTPEIFAASRLNNEKAVIR